MVNLFRWRTEQCDSYELAAIIKVAFTRANVLHKALGDGWNELSVVGHDCSEELPQAERLALTSASQNWPRRPKML